MYSSGYVSKHGLQAQKKKYRSKGKSCGYYMRIVFFFSSLIQSLIIVSLVLFLIYGKNQDSASLSRIQDLEESFSRLSIENVDLRKQRTNLTNQLNATTTEKTRNDWDLSRCRYISNVSSTVIQNLHRDLQKCNVDLVGQQLKIQFAGQCPPTTFGCDCGLQTNRLKAELELLNSNFTQTTEMLRIDRERVSRERDDLRLESIHLRRDKATHEKALEFAKLKCKEDFVHSLSGVSNVSRAFLQKIESLFTVMPFHITCNKQREYLEQINYNCTSLSRDVEDKFQQYLNNVGDQVASIQLENSHLKAENQRQSADYRLCSQNRSGMILQHRKNLEKVQLKYDLEKEELILEKKKLNGEKEVLENSVKLKATEVQHLKEQINLLNSTCRAGGIFGGSRLGQSNTWNNFNSGGSTSPGLNQNSRGGLGSSSLGSNSRFGSTGFGLNRQGSTGLGSTGVGSVGSNSNFGSAGSGLNKQSSTGLGFGSTGSSSNFGSTGSGLNKQSSPGLGSPSIGSTGSGSSFGSTGSGLNKPSSTGLGSTGFGSTGSNSFFGSTGSGSNKQGSTGLGSTGVGSAGSGLNKQSSTGLGSLGFGSTGSSSNFGSTGSGLNRQSSTGLGSSSLGANKQGSTGSGAGSTSSSGTSLNKPVSNGRSSSLGSSGLSTSQSSTGTSSSKDTGSTSSTSKSSGAGFSWFGLGSNSNKPSTGSGTGTGTGTGTGAGRGSSTGSSFNFGSRASGFGGGSVNVAQHLQDLQRIINPSAPQ
ncbi:uncharacterized protein ACB057_012479 [Neosynchiropus ocellatus]